MEPLVSRLGLGKVVATLAVAEMAADLVTGEEVSQTRLTEDNFLC
jgi:hypothetical protein